MIATPSASAMTKAAAATTGPMFVAALLMHSLNTYVWQGYTVSDFPCPHRDDQSEIVQECLAVNAGMEKADLPAEETALP